MAKQSLEEELGYLDQYSVEAPGDEAQLDCQREEPGLEIHGDIRVVKSKDEEEGGDIQGDTRVVKAKRRVRAIVCIYCGERATHPGRHANKHLPWFWQARTACWICRSQQGHKEVLRQHVDDVHGGDMQLGVFGMQGRREEWVRLVNGCFWELSRLLNCVYPQGLVDLANQWMAPGDFRHTRFTEAETEMMPAYMEINQVSVPAADYTTSILTESTVFGQPSLLHWRVLLHLLTKLSPDQQEAIRSFDTGKDQLGLQADKLTPEPMPIADAHFHLDKFMSSAGSPGLHELDKMGTDVLFDTDIKIAVANFCFPDRYPTSELRSQIRKERKVVFSYGLHPRVVNSRRETQLGEDFRRLKDMLQSTRVVAVGECGLDTSDRPTPSQLRKQVNYLVKQLELAVWKNLTVVIHCRGDSDLHYQLLECLSQTCPASHPIHWHCFTGSQEVFEKINARLTNIVFGVTPFIFKDNHPEVPLFIAKNGLQQLVLESDAPFISYEGRSTTPYVVNYVAAEIAKRLGIAVERVVEVTTANVQRIYGGRV